MSWWPGQPATGLTLASGKAGPAIGQPAYTAPNQARYYRVTGEPGQVVRLKLHRASDSAVSELYVGSGGLPTRWRYDARAVNSASADQELTLPTGLHGTLYVLAYSSVRPESDAGAFPLTAEPVTFGITAIDQSQGDRGGPLTVRIRPRHNAARHD